MCSYKKKFFDSCYSGALFKNFKFHNLKRLGIFKRQCTCRLIIPSIRQLNRPWKSFCVWMHCYLTYPSQKNICLLHLILLGSPFELGKVNSAHIPFPLFFLHLAFATLVNAHWLTKSSEKLCNDAIEAFLNVASISFGTGWKCVVSFLQCKTDFVTVCGHNKRVILIIMGVLLPVK